MYCMEIFSAAKGGFWLQNLRGHLYETLNVWRFSVDNWIFRITSLLHPPLNMLGLMWWSDIRLIKNVPENKKLAALYANILLLTS